MVLGLGFAPAEANSAITRRPPDEGQAVEQTPLAALAVKLDAILSEPTLDGVAVAAACAPPITASRCTTAG